MRVTLTTGARSFLFLIGDPAGKSGAPLRFDGIDALVEFIRKLENANNQAALSLLKKTLLSSSGDTGVRFGGDQIRRLAQAFIRSSGVIVDVTPKKSGGGGSGSGGASSAAPEPTLPKPAPPLRSAGTVVPLTTFEILSVEVISDHRKLKDDATDWRNAGRRFPKPEWESGTRNPVSHSHQEKLGLRVQFTAGPPDGRAQSGELVGRGGGTFNFDSGARSIVPGENTIIVHSWSEIPFGILKRELELAWKLALDKDGTLDGGTTSQTLYCTYGTPMDDRTAVLDEDGVTVKRMEAAIELGREVDTDWPHKLVKQLMGRFGGYRLAATPESAAIPEKYRHPHYKENGEGGAWAMAEYAVPGECQAIVRFVWGVIRQLGLPGEAEGVLVYALPKDPQTPCVDALGDGDGLGEVLKTVGESVWLAALTDQFVRVGKFYRPSHSVNENGTQSPGFNQHETCLAFKSQNKTVYYAGGIGGMDTLMEVLHSFKQLVWVERVKDPILGKGYRIREVVAEYQAREDADAAV